VIEDIRRHSSRALGKQSYELFFGTARSQSIPLSSDCLGGKYSTVFPAELKHQRPTEFDPTRTHEYLKLALQRIARTPLFGAAMSPGNRKTAPTVERTIAQPD